MNRLIKPFAIHFITMAGLILFPFFIDAQLSGNVFLSGQTNHNNIKVKFTAQSGLAVTDSALTSPTGNYSINITNGIYIISFSKPGYISAMHNNGTATLLTNTVALPSATLLPGNQVIVSGNVSGNWTSNNTYIVSGDITIPTGSALSIQAGTSVKFNGYYSLTANGNLFTFGTTANPVLFTSNIVPVATNNWNSIKINSSSSVIDHCIVEYCDYGLNADNASPVIANSIFRNMPNIALSLYESSAHVIGNEIYNIINNQANASIGIGASNSTGSLAVIECNHIYSVTASGWNAYGIRAWDNTLVRNNEVDHISGYTSRGIDIGPTKSRVESNHIHHCGNGIQFYNPTTSPEPIIINNVIHSNTNGILTSPSSIGLRIVNNIIVNNDVGIIQGGGTGPDISFNLVWNNSTANYQSNIAGIGQMVSTNAQGNAIDPYFNMSQDPLFAGGTAPLLSPTSPCLSAGNSTYSPNMGLLNNTCERNGTPSYLFSINPDKTTVRVFPNPGNEKITIETGFSGKQKLELYDISGNLVLAQSVSDGEPINISHLNAGVFNLLVKTDKGFLNTKIVILR